MLRAPAPQDAPRIAALANDLDIARMTKRMPHPFRMRDADDFVLQVASQDPARANTFVIDHEDAGPIGVIGLFEGEDRVPETGYWIGRDYWGRGFATEALDAALVWASRKWKRRALVAGHFADNPASGRVLEEGRLSLHRRDAPGLEPGAPGAGGHADDGLAGLTVSQPDQPARAGP